MASAVNNKEEENRLTVHQDGRPAYDIVLREDFSDLCREVTACKKSGRRILIVTDSNVERLYLNEVKEVLSQCSNQVFTFVFPTGEVHKNLDTVRDLYRVLIREKFDRGDLMAALGGGVTGDLCGFAAATYQRGISFIQIPTTLLSQVDSSIGGKTGVDFDAYKNMVGAFHMPALVYTNIRTLATLPEREYSAGMGEVLKHGLIKSRDYYDWLLSRSEALLNRDSKTVRMAVAESNRIKRAVVEADPTEAGERMLLNFGHTLGHAIEKLKGFELLHGDCVALGALAAMRISRMRGLLTDQDLTRFRSALSAFHLPCRVSDLSQSSVIETSKNDKKMEAGVIQFVLLQRIGCAYVDRSVTDSEIRDALDYIFF